MVGKQIGAAGLHCLRCIGRQKNEWARYCPAGGDARHEMLALCGVICPIANHQLGEKPVPLHIVELRVASEGIVIGREGLGKPLELEQNISTIVLKARVGGLQR